MTVTPPRATKKHLTHELHGEPRPDDYHWLKTQGKADPEVLAYLHAENAWLDEVMAPLRGTQQAIYQELLSHVQERDDQPPVPEGDFAYFTRTEEGRAHPMFLRRPLGGGEEEVLLDLNALKEREGHANVWVYATRPSPDGRYWAYLLDTTGQEVFELRVLDTRTGELAEAPLTGVGGWTLAWGADSSHLYYVRDDATQRPYQLWRHTLGQPQDTDELLYQEDDPTFRVGAFLSENGDTLLLASEAGVTSEWHALDAHDPQARPQLILPRERGTEYSVTDGGDHWLALTNQGGASEFRLVTLPKQAGLTWADATDVLPHDPERYLTGMHLFRSHLLVSGREGGFTRLWVLPRLAEGYGAARRVEFPEASYTVKIGPNHVFETTSARILYTSLTRPPEHLDLDLNTLETVLIKVTPVPNYHPALYVSEQAWAVAPDGERVPVSLVRRRDTPLPAPTLLYGYGSYGFPIDPEFRSVRLPLLDRGWVWAIAHIRGGSELGRRWYDAGRLAHKMNTFTDFIAAAEHLRASGVATDLVAMGRSAGGLLMGAVLNLRPDLFRAAFVGVPFVDVLSTMLDESIPLTTGEYDEWGNPNEAEAYAGMRAYSPYDNLKAVTYPHLFVSTGLNDPRVAYWEPAKYVARLRDLRQPGSGELVLKTNLGAGHGGSSGRYDALQEIAEEYAFALAAVEGELDAEGQ
ncbi:S9 family peptidase [Deinococcus metallilatus]|uniref:Oligopeptidase B n=1 Tax=Deinococcus metallilatus TaxID=1211322 RepID=A0AAJ5F2U8_9DEIO|nr:S9 family peptidase [Deinococcus metallilatus]MBB5295561.1 oligopeptidase B [Deinococcus metallilatus]QBY07927.1 S9 family peptidase [Deinococcus metallilatus]RXJ12820.1 S9 family peptidase [Deinococcus metallilatus]TLK27258.1 S9 family peptidase [Deinococcus metallilatus]GMA16240.1 oligopeptidase B [Deinococcus metallilatus]